eukprot:CAMPEP_0172586402 /NCGR_PEP_ID=MMETSP1068-20121228/5782_1 /TAXON_ID=35684 /ORGANISM="Pseudopedinella elastica, Strain CCMP716" /LENGTH=97 /DNA_ID=CAMNT_0013381195 /DNA_START=27 /DNA_END=320 /DNA_ORIENTATION=-
MALRQLTSVARRAGAPKRFMSAAEPYIPATNAPANITKAREVLCKGGTWQGAAGPTYLKEGPKDAGIFFFGNFLQLMIAGGFLSGLYKMSTGTGKLD